jgi:hypothetical protein
VESNTTQPSRGLAELIGRALTDERFRAMLYEDRATVLESYELSPGDIEALERLDRETLEQYAQRFGAEGTAALMIKLEDRPGE